MSPDFAAANAPNNLHSPRSPLRARILYCMADADAMGTETAPVPEYSEDGIDLSLIRWMLSLTPAERLRFLEDRMNEISAIRELNAGN